MIPDGSHEIFHRGRRTKVDVSLRSGRRRRTARKYTCLYGENNAHGGRPTGVSSMHRQTACVLMMGIPRAVALRVRKQEVQFPALSIHTLQTAHVLISFFGFLRLPLHTKTSN